MTEHLQETARLFAPDMILIDIAGSYEQALTIAIARAHLTIIPASTTEADIFEAARVARHIQTIFAAFGKIPLYRVLATRVAPLVTHAQAHGFRQIARLKLPLMKSLIAARAAYEEIGLSELPPHYADPGRPTTIKAVAELDLLRAEIDTLLEQTYGGSGLRRRSFASGGCLVTHRPSFRDIAPPLDVDDGALKKLADYMNVPVLRKPEARPAVNDQERLENAPKPETLPSPAEKAKDTPAAKKTAPASISHPEGAREAHHGAARLSRRRHQARRHRPPHDRAPCRDAGAASGRLPDRHHRPRCLRAPP